MKTILIFLTLLVLCTLSLEALDIDAQMQTIRESSPQDRVKLMNELKRQIAKMNQDDRAQAINDLRSKMNKKSQMHQRASRGQKQNIQNISHNQSLNQQQAGKQYMHTKDNKSMKFNK